MQGAQQAGTYSRPGADPVVLSSGSDYNRGSTQYSSDRPWGAAGDSNESYRSSQGAHATGQSGASLVGQAESDFKQGAGSHSRRSDAGSDRDSVVGGSSRFNQAGQRDSPVSTSTQSTFSTTRPGSNYESSYRPSSTAAQDGTNLSSSNYGTDSAYNHDNNYGHEVERPGSNYGNDNVNRSGSQYGSDSARHLGSEHNNPDVSRPSSNHGNVSHSSQQGYASESTSSLPATGIPPPFHPPSYIMKDSPRFVSKSCDCQCVARPSTSLVLSITFRGACQCNRMPVFVVSGSELTCLT